MTEENKTQVEPIKLGDHLTDMVKPLREAMVKAEKQLDAIQGAKQAALERFQQAEAAQRKEITKGRRALSLIDPTYAPPPPKQKRSSPKRIGVPIASGTATGFGISLESVKRYVDEILRKTKGDPKVYVTQIETYTALDEDQNRASAAFRYLREIGFLGKAGRDPGSRRERFRVMDRDAYQRMVDDLKKQEEVASG